MQVSIDRRLVVKHQLLVGAMRNRHEVHIRELWPALAPVRMGQDVMTADLTPGVDLSSGRDAPVKERIVARDALTGSRWFHVLEERRESSNNLSRTQRLRHAGEFIRGYSCFSRAHTPRIRRDFIDCAFPLPCREQST